MRTSKDKKKTSKTSGKFSIMMSLMLFILVIGLAFITYSKSKGIDIESLDIKDLLSHVFAEKDSSLDKEQKKALEFEYDWREGPVFGVLKEYIVKCTREYLKVFNKEGKEIWMQSILMNKPLIKSNGSEAIIVDVGGRDIYVLQSKGIKWQSKAEDTIINADISKNGYVSIIEECRGFKAKIKVFDPLGIEMFSRSIAERFILNAVVAPSSEQLLISGIDVSNITSSSCVEFTSMRGDPFSARVLRENQIFPLVRYMDDDSVVAVNENTLILLDKHRDEKWEKSFDRIYSCNVLLGKYIVVATHHQEKGNLNASDSEVKILDLKGQQTASCQISGEVYNIETYSDMIAVNTGREVYFINSKGKPISRISSKSDVSEVYFLNKHEVVVVAKNHFTIIDLGGG